MENNTLATELLHEIKASAKRWFIIAIAELVIIVMIIGTFIWYLTLPIDESLVDISNDAGITTYVGNDLNGVLKNGENSSPQDTQSDEKQVEQ